MATNIIRYDFTVEGYGEFPIDMLRYDAARGQAGARGVRGT